MEENKILPLIPRAEEERIAGRLTAWMNTCPGLPAQIERVRYEQMPANTVCMALDAVQGAYITKRYILGGHQSEYPFKVIYRHLPDVENQESDADGLLDRLGDWAQSQRPQLGEGVRIVRIELTQRSAVLAAYDSGYEDHQILLKLIYEEI